MTDHNRFVEFIEMNQLFGVQKLVFYLVPSVEIIKTNRKNNELIREYLEFYRNEGLVDIYDWNITEGKT